MWRPPMSGPNSAGGVATIVARSRDLARNNAWAGAAIDRSVSAAIATGVQVKQIWGDAAFKVAVKKLWKRSCKRMDADGVLEYEGLQALAWREWREAGEVFIRIRSRRPEDGLPVPVQIQLIESEQCPRDHWITAPNGNPIRAGVEFSKIGARVAYWMYREHPGDRNVGMQGGGELIRVPAEQVMHLYRPMRAGEIRGTPDMAAVIVRAHKLERLDDNVLEREGIKNLFAGFYTREANSNSDSPLNDTQTGTDDDGTPLAGLEPGTMQELPEGVKVEFSTPPSPGSDYVEFVRSNLMAFCARIGIPYEVVTGDLRNVSDRALRLILNEFHRLIEMDLWLYFLPKMGRGVREAWFDAAILSGALVVAGYADIRDDVTDALYVPEGWPYSHPVQDVTSDIKAIRAGLTTRTKTVLSNGEDPEEIDAEQAEDNARADGLGLVYDSDSRVDNMPPPEPNQQTEDEDK